MKRLIALLVALAILGSFAPRVGADDGGMPKLSLRPISQSGAHFQLEIEPGEHETLTVALGNHGDAAIDARTYAADVYSLVNGGFGVRLADEPSSGATTWLDYQSEVISLAPATEVEREFTLSIPEETRPGEYIAGLVVENAEPIEGSGEVALNQVIRQAIAILITVPGEAQPGLKIGAASHNPIGGSGSILVAVENTGYVWLKPHGELTVTAADGSAVLRQPVEMDSVFAGTTTAVEVMLTTPMAAGDYTVELSLTDDEYELTVNSGPRPMTVAATETVPVATVEIQSLTITESRDDSGELRYVEPAFTLTNAGAPVAGGFITLHVTKDGEPVEDFVLASLPSLPMGSTDVRQRYLPADGWQPGEYHFTVTFDVADTSGNVTTLASAEVETSVTVS